MTIISVVTESNRLISFISTSSIVRVMRILKDLIRVNDATSSTVLSEMLGTFKTFPATEENLTDGQARVVVDFFNCDVEWNLKDKEPRNWDFSKFEVK